jgi:alanyl-tRNA synthetase
METRVLYHDYEFDKLPETFTASIVEKRSREGGQALILDKTVFYPEGGGQPGDRGTINGIPVIDVREEGGEILHIIAADAKPGGAADAGALPASAELAVDQRRRRDFTVQHSAQHLLSGTMLRLTGFPTVSMRLGEDYNTIDVDAPALDTAELLKVEDAVMTAIEENHPLIIHLCPPEKAEDFPLRKVPPKGEEVIRIVEIEGNDFSPCCGTHAASTGQIGMLRILGAEKYKGMTRVTFIAGRRCLEDSRMLRQNGARISRLLKVPVEETGGAVTALAERAAALEQRLKALEEEAARREAAALHERAAGFPGPADPAQGSAGGALYAESFSGKSMEEVFRIGKQAQKLSGSIFVLGSEQDLKFAALCSRKDLDIRPRLQSVLEDAGGKGGGGSSFFQGQFDSPEKYRNFFALLGPQDHGH